VRGAGLLDAHAGRQQASLLGAEGAVGEPAQLLDPLRRRYGERDRERAALRCEPDVGAVVAHRIDAMFTPEGLPGVPTFLDVAHASAVEAERIVEGFQEAFSWLGRPGIVSVAGVQGNAIGAGFQLALACDLRIAAQSSRRLCVPRKTRWVMSHIPVARPWRSGGGDGQRSVVRRYGGLGPRAHVNVGCRQELGPGR
jgi:hypothetical protein